MNEQIREEFEQVIIESDLVAQTPYAVSRDSQGDYIHNMTSQFWVIWQAAHARYAGSGSGVVAPAGWEIHAKVNAPADIIGQRIVGYRVTLPEGVFSEAVDYLPALSTSPAVPANAYEIAASIVDFVLKDATLHRLPDEDGKSPTYCMGLGSGGTLMKVKAMLSAQENTSPAPAVPDAAEPLPDNHSSWDAGYNEGWNACREAMLTQATKESDK